MEFKVASHKTKYNNNHKSSAMLTLTSETQDEDTIRLYKMLFERCKEDGNTFDPLGMFGEQ